MSQPDFAVSVVLPCFNEAPILARTVERVDGLLSRTCWRHEIIIAEDASTDGTDRIAAALAEAHPHIVWLHRPERIGRGSAVAAGIRAARGRYAGFLDVDLEVAAHHLIPLLIALERGADVATAARKVKLDLWQLVRVHRLMTHYGYRALSRWLLGTSLQDTETGFKFFRREVILPILDQIVDQHWFWDTEVMILAERAGLEIQEVPALFEPDTARVSKVAWARDSLVHFKGMLRLRRSLD